MTRIDKIVLGAIIAVVIPFFLLFAIVLLALPK